MDDICAAEVSRDSTTFLISEVLRSYLNLHTLQLSSVYYMLT